MALGPTPQRSDLLSAQDLANALSPRRWAQGGRDSTSKTGSEESSPDSASRPKGGSREIILGKSPLGRGNAPADGIAQGSHEMGHDAAEIVIDVIGLGQDTLVPGASGQETSSRQGDAGPGLNAMELRPKAGFMKQLSSGWSLVPKGLLFLLLCCWAVYLSLQVCVCAPASRCVPCSHK